MRPLLVVVQASCTTSTEALYYQYKPFVPIVQRLCTKCNTRIYNKAG